MTLVDVVLRGRARRSSSRLRDALVGLGLERAQRQVLQLPLELPDAEAVGERREEIERLARGLPRAALVVRADQEAQRLRALGELDQHDADVLDHRQQHLAQVLGLRVALLRVAALAGDGADRAHARHADDELRDLGAEAAR